MLNINLRKPLDGVPLTVTFNEQAALTTVTVDTAAGPVTGFYTLTLQSFDTNSNGVESTLNSVAVTVVVTDYIRDVACITELVVTRGDLGSFDVQNVYSVEAIGTLAVNLRQLTGSELVFVDFIEATGVTTVEVTTSDPTQVPDSAVYTLTLESFDTVGILDPAETLKTDIVTLYITDYIRDADLVQVITMRQDVPFTYVVPHCYAELTQLPGLGYNIDVKLRE